MVHALIKQMKEKSIRALAKVISFIENDHPSKYAILNDLYPLQTNCHYIGITGSPGAGKSTLVDQLVSWIRHEGKTAAVIAVDPTSPFSGGALLGDRVRMSQHFSDDGVYIRSMASRGSLGGLAKSTKDVMRVCGAYGFDVVIVETVGVGQSEFDIMNMVDSTVVVLTPNSGDILQVFKAGIMEIADIFVINKADLQGATKLGRLLQEFVNAKDSVQRTTPIIKTVATENRAIDQLWEQLKEHFQYRYDTKAGEQERMTQYELEIYHIIQDELLRDIKMYIEGQQDTIKISQQDSPYQIALEWYEKWKKDVSNK